MEEELGAVLGHLWVRVDAAMLIQVRETFRCRRFTFIRLIFNNQLLTRQQRWAGTTLHAMNQVHCIAPGWVKHA